MNRNKTFDNAWLEIEDRYKRFLTMAKRRPNKVCYGLSKEEKRNIEVVLALVTVRLKDSLPQ